MTNTYYTSLTGMMAASYGLQNTSNNVANMQSPGFKRSDVFYSSLGNGAHHEGLGSGVYVGGQSVNFAAGLYTATGNPADLAVVGDGFFIVKMKNGEFLYTRDGEFEFNSDGLLADKHSGGLVQGYNKQGALVNINQFGAKTNPGKPDSAIDLKGEFIIVELKAPGPGEPAHDPKSIDSIYEHIKFSVHVYDNKGKEHEIELELEAPNTPHEPGNTNNYWDYLSWNLISVKSKDGADIKFDFQKLKFESDSNGAADISDNKLKFTLNGNQEITLNFGGKSDDYNSSVRLYRKDQNSHTSTKIEVNKRDGYGVGKQIDFSFDDNGQISYKYNNGQSEEGIHVALARFDDMEHTLLQANDNLFRAKNQNGTHVGRANINNLGTIKPKGLENSNVDSTREFANIVVLQRMFQACSQIMDIDKQLLEGLIGK